MTTTISLVSVSNRSVIAHYCMYGLHYDLNFYTQMHAFCKHWNPVVMALHKKGLLSRSVPRVPLQYFSGTKSSAHLSSALPQSVTTSADLCLCLSKFIARNIYRGWDANVAFHCTFTATRQVSVYIRPNFPCVAMCDLVGGARAWC